MSTNWKIKMKMKLFRKKKSLPSSKSGIMWNIMSTLIVNPGQMKWNSNE